MKRLASIGLLLLVAGVPLAAQMMGPRLIDALDDTAPFNVPSTWVSMAFQITGNAANSVGSFQCQSNGVTFRNVQVKDATTGVLTSVTTAGGIYTLPNAGYLQCQVKMTSYGSGGWNVTLTNGSGVNAQYPSTPDFDVAAANKFCLSASTKDSYFSEVGANNPGAYTNGSNCGSGTLRFDWNSTRVLFAVPVEVPDGTGSGIAGLAFGAEPTSGLSRRTTNQVVIQVGGSQGVMFDINGAVNVVGGYKMNASLNAQRIIFSATNPTISSGFGTDPTIVTANGTAAFTINVGTGGSASSGVIGFTTATTGWAVHCDDVTTKSSTVFVTKQTAVSSTTATVGNFDAAGAAQPWAASDILVCQAIGY